jgi:ubiquinone biosynthesis protein UbiJ
VQPVAFKATEEKKEESTPSRLPIDASKLDNEEMALIITSFRQILKQRRGKDYKPRSKRVCYKCGKPSHFIAKFLCLVIVTGRRQEGEEEGEEEVLQEEGRRCPRVSGMGLRHELHRLLLRRGPRQHRHQQGSPLPQRRPQVRHGKGWQRKKVKSRASTKYTTTGDEGSSSEDEDNLLTLFANLNMQQNEKLNELIGAIHEKDELLDSQEEFLIKENKTHVKVKNAYAQEVEKCENLTKELSTCHDTISNLRTENVSLITKVEKLNVCNDSIVNLENENASLIAKIDKLNESISSLKTENASLISKARDLNVCNNSISCLRNENAILHAKIDELNACKPSTSSVDHVTICTRCRDVNIDAIHDHLALIK